jgi:hypothetical protein
MLNTDLLPPGGTLTLAFLPTTPGNWLFHCHFSFHMNDEVTLSGSPRDSAEAAHPMPRHEGAPYMRGLVIGIRVLPKAGYVAYSAVNPRELRLLVQKKAMQLPGNADAYGFVLQAGDSVPAKDSVNVPGPTLELVRGQPVRITVVNHLEEPTGIHWHGLEIPSYPDGVPRTARIFSPPWRLGAWLMSRWVRAKPPTSSSPQRRRVSGGSR